MLLKCRKNLEFLEPVELFFTVDLCTVDYGT